jgi:hypothetical protein
LNQRLKAIAVPALRWTLGVVILLQSVELAFSTSVIRHFAQTGLPPWRLRALAGGEIVAVLLFLLPATSLVGGCLLLLVFALAIALHFHLGDFHVGGLVVYPMAAIVCMTHQDRQRKEAAHDVKGYDL